jgi:phosphonate transport system substrate-binding protein
VTAPARAPADRGDEDELRIGLALAAEPAATQRRLASFCASVTRATGITALPRGVDHYHRLLELLDRGEVDLAWLPPILAMKAMGRIGVIALALPIRRGTGVYSSALFAREGSPVRGLADLSGLRAAWVDRESASGYLVLRAHLRSLGVDLNQAFSSDHFYGTHDAVTRAVLDGEADVGATFLHPEPAPGAGAQARSAGWGDARVQIITEAGPIPSDILVASMRTPVAVSRKVQRALVKADDPELAQTARELFEAEGFVVPLPEHLSPLSALLSRMDE